MKTKLIKLALSFFSSDDGRKFVRNVAVVIISPFVAITVLIGAIFSDGISFNHNLVTDLFEGNPISELTDEMKKNREGFSRYANHVLSMIAATY